MAKNFPITAKVNKGLFGQKVTEPVLNVGQAGVSGNNITKGDPSPAKMMKSPLKQMKSENAGQKIMANQARVTSTSTTPDKVIKGGTTTAAKPYSKKWDEKKHGKYSDWIKKPENKKKEAAFVSRQTETKTLPDTVVKGDTETETVPLTTFREGSAKTSFWRRQDERSIAHSARKTKRAEIDLAKAEADVKGLKGSERRDFVGNAKKEAKLNQAKAKVAGYTGVRETSVLQAEQSTRVNDKLKGVHLNPNKEETLYASEVKSSDVENARTQFKAKTGKLMADGATGTTNPITDKKPLAETTTPDVKKFEKPKVDTSDPEEPTAIGKKSNNFFGKKSPLKLKYFK